jgi:hypothetical protein
MEGLGGEPVSCIHGFISNILPLIKNSYYIIFDFIYTDELRAYRKGVKILGNVEHIVKCEVNNPPCRHLS